MSAESPLPAGWSSPIGSAQSKDIRPAVEIDERRPPVDPGRLRCERVLDFLTCADWAPSNMVGANADGDRGLVYACQQSQRTAQAELIGPQYRSAQWTVLPPHLLGAVCGTTRRRSWPRPPG
jgi:hypothetical protein